MSALPIYMLRDNILDVRHVNGVCNGKRAIGLAHFNLPGAVRT